MISPHRFLHRLQPITTNEGASFGPRISTAGYEWREKYQAAGWLVVRMYADLDGALWQEDWDVSRRGAQAIVPFSKRASAAIRAGLATVSTEPVLNQKGWFRTALTYEDRPEEHARRIICYVDYPEEDGAHISVIAEHERRWVSRFDEVALLMGTGLQVSVNDNRNRAIFHRDAA